MNRLAQNFSSKRHGQRSRGAGSRGTVRLRSGLAALGLASASGLVACGNDDTKVSEGQQQLEPQKEQEDRSRPLDSSFQKVTLNGAPGEPIGLVVLPDGRVLHTTRAGRVYLHDPATGFNRVVANIPVYQHDEEGLQGIAVDAHFADNGWVYIYYSPPLNTPSD
ncbi:MAG: hypothetical protein RL033_1483, partial [Pseudomonadota bacterium]